MEVNSQPLFSKDLLGNELKKGRIVMSSVETEIEHIKDGRFLKHKPTTMYNTPYRIQYFHDHNGPHSKTYTYLCFHYDTHVVHLTDYNFYANAYYSLAALNEFHPHLCVSQGESNVLMYTISKSHKFSGHIVFINFPFECYGNVFNTFGKDQKVVFIQNKVDDKIVEYLKNSKVEGEYTDCKKGNCTEMRKGNITLVACEDDKFEEGIISDDLYSIKLVDYIKEICNGDLTFSKAQDKGMMIFNALILFFIILIFYITSGSKKENKSKEN